MLKFIDTDVHILFHLPQIYFHLGYQSRTCTPTRPAFWSSIHPQRLFMVSGGPSSSTTGVVPKCNHMHPQMQEAMGDLTHTPRKEGRVRMEQRLEARSHGAAVTPPRAKAPAATKAGERKAWLLSSSHPDLGPMILILDLQPSELGETVQLF